MNIILKSKGGGKTTELIESAKRLEGYNLIICKDRGEALRLWKIILEKGYNIPQPITFDEFLKGNNCGRKINSFLIDNADLLLQSISKGVKIHTITMTEDEEKK